MPAKKKSRSKANSIAVQGPIPKMKLNMALDDKKIAAIQKCVNKGQLSITISKVDLVTGRIGDSWLYD